MKIHVQSLVSQLTKPKVTLSTTRILHALIIKSSLTVDPFYATKILRFYAINNDLVSARNLFDRSPERSVYLWNSIIRAYAQARHFPDAFLLFKRMLTSQTQPDNFTFACLVRACSDKSDDEALRIVHGKLVASGLGFDFICSSALVNSYSKLGLVDEASCLFLGIDGEPDLVLCNAMVSCYGRCGDWMKAVAMFKSMLDMGIRPDGYTVVGLITGLATHTGLMNVGEMVHAFCVKCGLDLSDHVGSMLVCMYSRCECIELARTVFENLVQPDLVSWSALIAGLGQTGEHVEALMFFKEFVMFGGRADPPLLATVLAAAAQSAIVGPGCEIHGYAVRHGCDTSVAVSSALVDMYAKCGFLEMSMIVFRNMPRRNIVTFNTVIWSLGLYGRGREALRVFDWILEEGMRPDETTFGGILCACCHSGLVEEGRRCFGAMREGFGMEARTEHYVYMVKLLGMDGRLEEAYDLVRSLAEPVDSAVWGALLSCCEYHRNYEVLEVIAKHFCENEGRNSSYKVMLSNVFARLGRWECVERLRRVDDAVGAKGKLPGSSWISS
ncbi:putative pentatricopeptide repeat-containing protein At1g64310 [Salvia miltiorrhiza]|uniref:Pentatricopeptide repeat protein n=1 Tax=Salvia miltiorrhiza TaxID=226208 RepID=A0A678WD87_SALMI|nr:putative pentatricopeptide repeat-containing protein At1g64310 [Salvia miltiorrhiza]AYM00703.1 pentatricopeptide repeat protein [Salvia miltiorrhiza]